MENYVISLFRELHKLPEYGHRLPLTKRLVCAELDKIGVEYSTFDSHDGIVADVISAHPGRTVAYRADMDALHVTEDSGLPYSSTIDGCMHACGHDAHTAVAICALRKLYENREKLHGRVRFLFEAGEETGNGAQLLIDDHALDSVDAIFSLHVGMLAGRDVQSGKFVILPGAVTAAKDKFSLEIIGAGGHGAYPSEAIDPIRISAQIITAIQSVVSMEVPSGSGAVVTFGSIRGGVDNNSIPDSVKLDGTVRTQNDDVRNLICRRITEITENLPRAFGGRGVAEIKRGSQTVHNDEKLAALAADAIAERFGTDAVIRTLPKALMGSDDFARFAKIVPGVYFFMSTCDPKKGTDYPNHNPKFAVDESVLDRAVVGVSEILQKFLNN